MAGRLAGKIAVVTGAGAGIGRTTAAKLAHEGADVAVADVESAEETKKLVEASGRRFFSARCDVSNEEQVNSFAKQVRSALGPVDIVVNNAAIVHQRPFEETPYEVWQRVFAVNVHGDFLVVRAFLDDLKRSSAGRVINMSSTSIWEANIDNMVNYISTKGAINGFTNALASALSKYNITVNAIAPSVVRTPATEHHLTEEYFDAHIQLQSLKRQQKPEDVANMIAYLASDEASFITGQIIAVDGGLSRR